MSVDLDKLKAQLALHEGRRNDMYADSQGVLTIGIGHNLQSNPISDAAVDQIFKDDLLTVLKYAANNLPWWSDVAAKDDVRARALLDFFFQMGSFKRFPQAEEAASFGRWEECANQLQFTNGHDGPLTPWYVESGKRAIEIVYMVRTGQDCVDYTAV